jgi:hypothetical protein
VLVVDASPHALKSGVTNPEELEKFVRADVEVHSSPGLHAKVFVFGSVAVIGSANASRRSAHYLQEAVLLTTDRGVVSSARDFVLDQTGEQLTIPHLRKLHGIYRPPRFEPNDAPRQKSKRPKWLGQPPLWLVPLEYETWDERDHEQADKARPAAHKLLKEDQKLDEFVLYGADTKKLRRGEQLIQVMTDGGQTRVYPPAHIIKMRRYHGARGAARVFVFVAIPERARARPIKKVRERLADDRKVLAHLTDLRRVRPSAVAYALRQIWRPR